MRLLLVAFLALFVTNQDTLRHHHEDHHPAAQAAPLELSLPSSFPGSSSFAVLGQAKRLAGMGEHILVRQPNQEMFAAGRNNAGQLATGAITADALMPQKANVSGINDVAAGVVNDTTPQVQCVGTGAQGQLGRGSTSSSSELQPVSGVLEGGVSEVFCGRSTSFAISAGSGHVYAWGFNEYGGLGVGTSGGNQLVPALVSLPLNFTTTQVGAGSWHACFLSSAGDVRCAGRNTVGQLGIAGSTPTSSTPLAVTTPGTTKFVSLAAGYYHTCATATDFMVYCWGDNTYYQLGSQDGGRQNKPTPVDDIANNARSVWAGRYNTFVIDNSSSRGVVAFGADADGVFGLGSTLEGDKSATPLEFGQGMTGIVEITGGDKVACILKQSGDVWCTGKQDYGQFGRGNQVQSFVLLQMEGLPTSAPTLSPTRSPTRSPTSSTPTNAPSNQPTMSPTSSAPTMSPTSSAPTMNPTSSASMNTPSNQPTSAPTSSQPTQMPTSSQPTQPTTAVPVSSSPTSSADARAKATGAIVSAMLAVAVVVL